MKKLFLGLGAVAAVVTPVVAVVSCGDKSSSKEATTPAQPTVLNGHTSQPAATGSSATQKAHADMASLQALPSLDELKAMSADVLADTQFVLQAGNEQVPFDFWGIITKVDVATKTISFRSCFHGKSSVQDHINKIVETAASQYDDTLIAGFDLSTVHEGDFISTSGTLFKRAAELSLEQIAKQANGHAVYFIPKTDVAGMVHAA